MEEITIVEIPDMRVLGIQRKGSYRLIPDLLLTVYRYAIKNGAVITGPPLFLCHETSPEAVKEANEMGTAHVEVVWPVSGDVKGSGEILAYSIPGGKMVHTVHRGPYETCEPTYLRLFSWIAEHGLAICGPIREMYPNNPHWVPREEIITEIFVPVDEGIPLSGSER
ncbi:MAG: GyrI-like domain-containing protein [Methanomicrobiales archaeon]|nr:GyrI-like domain-containing protein [Methanomicrobiales archaeon]